MCPSECSEQIFLPNSRGGLSALKLCDNLCVGAKNTHEQTARCVVLEMPSLASQVDPYDVAEIEDQASGLIFARVSLARCFCLVRETSAMNAAGA